MDRSSNIKQHMTELDLITSLPTRLSCDILQDWIDFISLRVLDSAYCCRNLRNNFLDLIRSDEVILHNLDEKEYSLRWLQERCVRVRYLFLVKRLEPFATKEYLSKFGSLVRMVTLSGEISPDVVGSVAVHCKKLIYIRNIKANIFCGEFCRVLQYNPCLEELRLFDDVFTPPEKISKGAFNDLKLPFLRVLSLSHRDLPYFCESVLKIGPNITQLELIIRKSPRTLSASTLLQIPQLCPHLRSLGLKILRINNGDNIIPEVVSACAGVVNLCIEDWALSDEDLLSIVTKLRGLRHLDLRGCSNLNSESLVHIYTHCADTLTALFLDTAEEYPVFETADLDMLLQRCTGLRTFGWSEGSCVNFDELGQVSVDDDGYFKLPPSISRLTSLLLGHHAVSDINLMNIAKYCPHLQLLSMHGAYHMEPEIRFTSEGLHAVALGCPELREVEIITSLINLNGYKQRLPFVQPALSAWQELRPSLKIFEDQRLLQKFDLLNVSVN